jgi:hypothetical protein
MSQENVDFLSGLFAGAVEVERISDHGDRVLVVAVEHGRGSGLSEEA